MYHLVVVQNSVTERALPPSSGGTYSCWTCVHQHKRRNVRFEGFPGGHYKECRLLGYKNPVRTSQETHNLCYRAQQVNAM
jgi:hypothetical protein